MASDAILYDGTTAHRHLVTVEPFAGSLRLSASAGWQDNIDAALLRRFDDIDGRPRLGRSDIAGWRLLLAHPLDPALLALLPSEDRYGGWIDRVGLGKATLGFAAIAALVLAAGHAAPVVLAPLVPPSWERNLGATMFGNFGDNRCRSDAGDAALRRLVARVDPGALRGEYPVEIHALNVNMFNAAALPGGYIVVFKGAIDQANGDAMAGVVAHELAHIHRRHVTQSLIRELGIGALVRLFAGGVGANVEQLVALSFTRANEAEADADARAMLAKANISPLPTAKLFARLARDEGHLMSSAQFLNSHPISEDRARAFAASFDRSKRYAPALDDAAQAALSRSCR